MTFAATYGTVEDIEVIWTLLGVIGAAFSIWNLRRARSDVVFLQGAGVLNGRLFLARSMRRAEYTRFSKQVLIIFTGLLAMLIESPKVEDLDTTRLVLSIVFRWIFIAFAALTAYQSYLAYAVRHEFERSHDESVEDAIAIRGAHEAKDEAAATKAALEKESDVGV